VTPGWRRGRSTHGDVLLEAHKIRVERGDYNIAPVHLADAIEELVRRSRPSLSDDRAPKDPYQRRDTVASGLDAPEPVRDE
jgi:hypothetical protein